MKRWRRNLFMFSKYLYPKIYRFGEGRKVRFQHERNGWIKKCPNDLAQINFNNYLNNQIGTIRKKLEIDVDFLDKCYNLEKKCLVLRKPKACMIDNWENDWRKYSDKIFERVGWVGAFLVLFRYYLNANKYESCWGV